MKKLLPILITLIAALNAGAEESAEESVVRPVMSAYTIEAGTSHLADTYLSPVRYSGMHAGLDYERMQAMRLDPRRWVMRLNVGVGLDRADNTAGNSTMWSAMLHASWSMMRRWNVAPGLTLAIGGNTTLDAGCLYLARNSNNPVAAKASWTIGATGMAALTRRLGRLPVTFTYIASVPAAGVFFSPAYGELYYEIYLGDTDGLAHFAQPGNFRAIDNRLTADLQLGSTSLRVGYHCEALSTKVNHITTRSITHSAIIGISGNWMSVGRGGLPARARMINALY